MKIAVFGATGGTGRYLVTQCLAAGHTVTAAVRDPASVTPRPEWLRVVRADVTDAASVESALEGQDGAISCVGPRPGKPPGTLISGAVRSILAGMQKHGVRRFAFESGLMVGDARGLNILKRVGVRIFRQMNRALYEDKVIAETMIRASAVEWVIVRPPTFGEIPPRNTFRIGVDLDAKLTKMANADVAAAMLRALTDDQFLRTAVEISY